MIFSISDEGIGIDKAKERSIFNILGQMPNDDKRVLNGNNEEHIGLGLSISKQIANHYGGDVDFVSEPNVGSTFFFSIEANQDDDEEKHYKPLFRKISFDKIEEDNSSENIEESSPVFGDLALD